MHLNFMKQKCQAAQSSIEGLIYGQNVEISPKVFSVDHTLIFHTLNQLP